MRYSRSLVVVAVATALAVPAWSSAQTAVPRNGGSAGGGSSAGSSGGGGGEAVSRGGDSGRAPAPSVPSFPTDSRRPSSSSTRGGESTSRSGGSGDSGVGPGTVRGGSAVNRSGNVGGAGSGSTYLGSRSRDGRPVVGSAIERPFGTPTPNYNLYFPYDPFSPWGRWYPWYYGGFGYGYVSFDPWRYGASRYSLHRYGAWYNPYDPWCYGVGYWLCDPWGGATTASYGGSYSTRDRDEESEAEPTGSVRLRVSPASAKVYVDGALVGTVADFSGLGGHLKLTVEPHTIEIKADGYETFTPQVEVVPGKTVTVRGTLKKIQ